jgi:hypothetical protein
MEAAPFGTLEDLHMVGCVRCSTASRPGARGCGLAVTEAK